MLGELDNIDESFSTPDYEVFFENNIISLWNIGKQYDVIWVYRGEKW